MSHTSKANLLKGMPLNVVSAITQACYDLGTETLRFHILKESVPISLTPGTTVGWKKGFAECWSMARHNEMSFSAGAWVLAPEDKVLNIYQVLSEKQFEESQEAMRQARARDLVVTLRESKAVAQRRARGKREWKEVV